MPRPTNEDAPTPEDVPTPEDGDAPVVVAPQWTISNATSGELISFLENDTTTTLDEINFRATRLQPTPMPRCIECHNDPCICDACPDCLLEECECDDNVEPYDPPIYDTGYNPQRPARRYTIRPIDDTTHYEDTPEQPAFRRPERPYRNPDQVGCECETCRRGRSRVAPLLSEYTINERTEDTVPEETLNPNVSFVAYMPGSTNYPVYLSKSFQYVRSQGGGHYSDRTVMHLQRNIERVDRDPHDMDLPFLVVAEAPFSYDEDTEVKSGGILGMLIRWPDTKTVIAVHRNSRRKSVGRRLFEVAQRNYLDMSFWVGRSNRQGQQFLLSLGMSPSAMNSQGGIRFSTVEEDENG